MGAVGVLARSGPLGRIPVSARVLHVSGFLTHALASLCWDLSPHAPLAFTSHIPTSTFLYLARMSASGSSWVCLECGKVCKSRGRLTQHSAVHKRHPHVRELDDNSTRFYHPNLDGRSKFLFDFSGSNLSKENHADRMESFSPMAPHLFSHSLSPTTIGLHSNRVLDLNSLRSYTAKPLSRMTLLTNFSASGVLR